MTPECNNNWNRTNQNETKTETENINENEMKMEMEMHWTVYFNYETKSEKPLNLLTVRRRHSDTKKWIE